MFAEHEVGAWAGDLLTNLFGALNGNPENEYIMKAIMRTIAAAKSTIMPLAEIVTGALNGVLMLVAKNPCKPRFNHFLFEAIGSAVRYCCPGNLPALEMFERELFPPFEALLQGDVLGLWWVCVFHCILFLLLPTPLQSSSHMFSKFSHSCLKAGKVEFLDRTCSSTLCSSPLRFGKALVGHLARLSGFLILFLRVYLFS